MTKQTSRRQLVLGGFAGLTCAVSTPVEAARLPLPVAHTPGGRIQGLNERGVLVFRGVRYAHVVRRFQPPQALSASAALQSAIQFGPRCPQRGMTDHVAEDCLLLNIWTPSLRGPPRPVLVYLHGGG